MCSRSAAPGSRRPRPSPPAILPASPCGRAPRRRCAASRVSSEAPIQRRPRRAFDWSSASIAVAVAVSAVMVYRRDGQARFLEIFFSDVELFIDILPKVLAACLIASFVAVLMPREVVLRWVGAELGFLGIVIATLAGIICPGGPITIFPIAVCLRLDWRRHRGRDRVHHQLDAARLRPRAGVGIAVLRRRVRDLAHHYRDSGADRCGSLGARVRHPRQSQDGGAG